MLNTICRTLVALSLTVGLMAPQTALSLPVYIHSNDDEDLESRSPVEGLTQIEFEAALGEALRESASDFFDIYYEEFGGEELHESYTILTADDISWWDVGYVPGKLFVGVTAIAGGFTKDFAQGFRKIPQAFVDSKLDRMYICVEDDEECGNVDRSQVFSGSVDIAVGAISVWAGTAAIKAFKNALKYQKLNRKVLAMGELDDYAKLALRDAGYFVRKIIYHPQTSLDTTRRFAFMARNKFWIALWKIGMARFGSNASDANFPASFSKQAMARFAGRTATELFNGDHRSKTTQAIVNASNTSIDGFQHLLLIVTNEGHEPDQN